MFQFKKSTALILLFVFLSCESDLGIEFPISAPEISFVKTFGGSNNESGRSVVATQDGGYAVLGYSQSIDGDVPTGQGAIQYDSWLLKFDAQDNLQWQKVFGGSKDDKTYQIIETSDNGFAIIGASKSNDGSLTNNQGFEDVWLLKLTANGAISWQTTTGFSGSDQGYSLTQTADGGYFVGGILDVSASGGQGNSKTLQRHAGGDYWAIKYSANGTVEWRKYFGGTNTDTCYAVIELADGYVLAGSSDTNDVDVTNNKGSYDFWLVKINKSGSLVWEKSFGGKEIDEAFSMLKTADNNILVTGDTRSSDQDVSKQQGASDIWLIKVSPDGNLLWERTYGGTGFDAARAVFETTEGQYIVAGNTRSMDGINSENKGANDVWLLKLSSSGSLIWQKSIGGSGIDLAFGLTQLQDKSIIIVGESDSKDQDILINKGFTDLLIIKLNEIF